MKVGTLWFDNSGQRDLVAKLQRAVAYYEQKHGERPTVCYIHPSMLVGAPKEIDGIHLFESNSVLPHHFWLGIGDKVTVRSAA